MSENKMVLVTGVAGFIASKTAELLLRQGWTVVGLDNLNDYYDVRLKDYRLSRLLGNDRFLQSKDPAQSIYRAATPESGKQVSADGKFIFYPLDIEKLPELEKLFEEYQFEAVLNLAARAGVRYSMENPFVYMTTNAMGTLNILDCMRKHGVKKHVMASTSSLYAGQKMPFTEDLPVNTPLSPYAASKKAGELMAYSYHKLYGLDSTIVRYFTVFGPAGRPDMSIFRFIKWIMDGKPIELFGDGSQSRDFTYVEDIARGTVAAMKPLGYEIINLGGGRNPISLNAVIAFIEKALGKKAQINYKPFHIADIAETWADISKADRLLGWKPQVSPEEGFQRSVDWALEHAEWLKDIKL
ncbi:MAG: NAD-dependent epimerase/dehydratase family protein [Verrucomicrobia bacterium]|jgi:nucleoside-diphosphate-sugar epimerase|nr:NAD-dependent epimerase/dehydratase family protein [Verrucomicrobiota bacterium]MBR4248828.1 NAD-dependent epimerase/dehydratase family protein [Verrucomicrobiota bacterium]